MPFSWAGLPCCALIGSLLVSDAHAEVSRPTTPDDSAGHDASGYCDFVLGVARSEDALLVAPRIFGTFGTLRSSDASLSSLDVDQGGLLGPLRFRMMTGLRYSFGELYQGLVNGSRAEAECQRYQVASALHALLQANQGLDTRSSLEAKAEVLKKALPYAENVLKKTRSAVESSRATIDELGSLELRTHELRAAIAETEAALGALGAAPIVPQRPVPELLRARIDTEAEVERLEAKLRHAKAWDFSIRGGYDKVFDDAASTGRIPLFGLASVTLNVGALWQFGGDARAHEGRLRWVSHEAEGLDQRVEQWVQKARSTRAIEQRRLEETKILLRDLEQRMKMLSALSGERVQKFRDYLWFDLVKIQAEHDYLTVHLRDLATLLHEER